MLFKKKMQGSASVKLPQCRIGLEKNEAQQAIPKATEPENTGLKIE